MNIGDVDFTLHQCHQIRDADDAVASVSAAGDTEGEEEEGR